MTDRSAMDAVLKRAPGVGALMGLGLLAACATAPTGPARVTPPPLDVGAAAGAMSACSGSKSAGARLDLRSDAAAVAATGRAERLGRTLTVGEAIFEDIVKAGGDEEAAGLYRYLGRYAGAPFDLVAFAPAEGPLGYILLDEAGEAWMSGGYPALSPDGFVFAAADASAGRVEILQRGEAGLAPAVMLDAPGPCDLAWRGAGRMSLKVGGAPAQVVRDASGWRLVPAE